LQAITRVSNGVDAGSPVFSNVTVGGHSVLFNVVEVCTTAPINAVQALESARSAVASSPGMGAPLTSRRYLYECVAMSGRGLTPLIETT